MPFAFRAYRANAQYGYESGQRGGQGWRPLRHIVQRVENDRHDRHRYQHDDGSGDGWGQDAPKQRKTRSKRELEKR